MKRVVIFSRVSGNLQDFSRQISQLKQFCKENDLFIVKDFAEIISGAKLTEERIIFSECINFVLNPDNAIDGLVVHEISRIGRRISETSKVIEDLHNSQKWIYSYKEHLYTLNDDKSVNNTALLILTLLQALAVNELDTLKYRVKSGIEESVSKGNAYGGIAPYGYKRIDKRFGIVEEEAEIIKEIFDLYLNKNMGCMQIAIHLNNKGIQTRYQTIGKTLKLKDTIIYPEDLKWSDGVINKLLSNKIYKGIRHYKKKNEIEIPECLIIEPDVFDAVQAKLKGNYNKKGINSKFEYIIDSKIIKCGCCGLSFFAHKRINGNDNAYKCLSHRYNYKGAKCGNFAINIDKLSNVVWFVVRNTEDLLKQLEENIANNLFIRQLDHKVEELTQKETELEIISRKENKLLDLFLEGDLNKDLYNRKNRTIQLHKSTLQYHIKKISKEIKDLQNSIDDLSDLNNQLRSIKASPTALKEYVMKIVKNIVIHPIKDNFTLSNYKGDKVLLVQVKLHTSLQNKYFAISQRSNSLVEIFENEIDFEELKIIGLVKDIKLRTKKTPTTIKI